MTYWKAFSASFEWVAASPPSFADNCKYWDSGPRMISPNAATLILYVASSVSCDGGGGSGWGVGSGKGSGIDVWEAGCLNSDSLATPTVCSKRVVTFSKRLRRDSSSTAGERGCGSTSQSAHKQHTLKLYWSLSPEKIHAVMKTKIWLRWRSTCYCWH